MPPGGLIEKFQFESNFFVLSIKTKTYIYKKGIIIRGKVCKT